MPRTARIDLPDIWYHIIARGHNRKTIFYDAQDFHVYLGYLGEKMGGAAVIGGFCLMPNHVHLLVNRRHKSLGTIFQAVNGRYGQYFNKKYKRVGYVFQNRYKSFLVLKQAYLDALVVYIHMNPVRAKLCQSARQHPWSTDAVYRLGRKVMPAVFRVVPGFEGEAGRRRYRSMMVSEIVEPPYFKSYIGTEKDLRDIERRTRVRNPEIDRRGRKPLAMRAAELADKHGITMQDLQSSSRVRKISGPRQQIMAALYAEQYRPTAIGKLFGRTATAVEEAVRSQGRNKT